MSVSVVVFDIGGVLVDWDPALAWMPEMGDRAEVEAFLARIDFDGLNLRADAGERFSDLATELGPDDGAHLAQYVARYTRTVPQAILGTWALLDRLLARGVPVHAITNWSAETWPEGHKVHPRLAEVFGVTVVSGQEKLLKPDPAIYHLFCDRAGVVPSACLFVDDKPANVDAARSVGMEAMHFTAPDALEQALAQRGLL